MNRGEYIKREDSDRAGFSCIRVSLIDHEDMSFYEDEMMHLERIDEDEMEDGFPEGEKSESLDDKIRKAVGSYVRMTCRFYCYEGCLDGFTVAENGWVSSVQGRFLRGGNKTFQFYEIQDIEVLDGTEADVLRGKITGETIQEYILPLTDEQLAFLAAELKVDLEDLPFLPEDRIGDIHKALVRDEDGKAAEACENGQNTDRRRIKAEIAGVIAGKIEEKRGNTGSD